jgi:hypothetical protein
MNVVVQAYVQKIFKDHVFIMERLVCINAIPLSSPVLIVEKGLDSAAVAGAGTVGV